MWFKFRGVVLIYCIDSISSSSSSGQYIGSLQQREPIIVNSFVFLHRSSIFARPEGCESLRAMKIIWRNSQDNWDRTGVDDGCLQHWQQ